MGNFGQVSLAVFGVLLVGCVADGAANGSTRCGDYDCQAGQYCVDADFSDCEPGCTSDLNCADNQRCVKPTGASVGDCQNVAQDPPGEDPPGEDPPGEDPPGEDPPGEDPPGEDPPGESEATATCRTACMDAAYHCQDSSITPAEVASCDAWCRDAGVTDSVRETFAACVEAAYFDVDLCTQRDCLPAAANTCGGESEDRACVDDDDCGGLSHCWAGQCYRDRTGSPCEIDDHCGGLSSCVANCCN